MTVRRLQIDSTGKISIFKYKLDRKSYYKTLCTEVCITLLPILSLTSTHITEYEVDNKNIFRLFFRKFTMTSISTMSLSTAKNQINAAEQTRLTVNLRAPIDP